MSDELGPILNEIASNLRDSSLELERFVQALVHHRPSGVDLLDWMKAISPSDSQALSEINRWAGHFDKNYRRFMDIYSTISINIEFERIFNGHYDENSYDLKKSYVLQVNEQLRLTGSAISHPSTGEPCLLLAVNSRDGTGRYTLQSRITKKRSGSYKSLSELLPIELVKDVPRKEGVIERRKKAEKKPD